MLVVRSPVERCIDAIQLFLAADHQMPECGKPLANRKRGEAYRHHDGASRHGYADDQDNELGCRHDRNMRFGRQAFK